MKIKHMEAIDKKLNGRELDFKMWLFIISTANRLNDKDYEELKKNILK